MGEGDLRVFSSNVVYFPLEGKEILELMKSEKKAKESRIALKW